MLFQILKTVEKNSSFSSLWSFAIYADLALAVTTLTTPSIELSCEEGTCFLGGLLSLDTAMLMYITGKCYFYRKSASASGNTSYLNAVPASCLSSWHLCCHTDKCCHLFISASPGCSLALLTPNLLAHLR